MTVLPAYEVHEGDRVTIDGRQSTVTSVWRTGSGNTVVKLRLADARVEGFYETDRVTVDRPHPWGEPEVDAAKPWNAPR